jgi:hypothetical protein
VEADQRQTLQEMAQEFDVDPATIFRNLSQIGEDKKLDKWVPHELNENQTSYEVCSALLSRKRTVSRSNCDVP